MERDGEIELDTEQQQRNRHTHTLTLTDTHTYTHTDIHRDIHTQTYTNAQQQQQQQQQYITMTHYYTTLCYPSPITHLQVHRKSLFEERLSYGVLAQLLTGDGEVVEGLP